MQPADSNVLKSLFESVENYSKTTFDLYKLYTIDKSAEVVSALSVQLALFAVITLFTFTINFGIALWLGEVLGKLYFGFFVVAGFYSMLGLLIYIFRKNWIKKPVSNFVIEQMIKENERPSN